MDFVSATEFHDNQSRTLRETRSKKPVILTFLLVALAMTGCGARADRLVNYDGLQEALTEFVADKDANIGVAVIINGKDTVAVNGDKYFPMLSVYKFPIALALGEHYRINNLSLSEQIAVLPEDLHKDTYSPMTDKLIASDAHIPGTLKMPTVELLKYMLQQSDNVASDIILKTTGGAEQVEKYLQQHGITGVNVKSSENEMHIDNNLCYANSSTPTGMASLMDKFDREANDSISIEIKRLMETCGTGTARLPKPLHDAVIGHKTGTGFVLSDGRLMAVNDAGYVHLSNGKRYSIAVFIENSGYDMPKTEEMIAEISRIVYTSLNN